MPKLEVFFDYACPYCLRGHRHLEELLPRYPRVEVVWRPCEAHPRPDPYGPHSDLCIQGMFYAAAQNVDLWDYHQRMYQAALVDRVNIESIQDLVSLIQDLLDPEDFREALLSGAYLEQQQAANQYAFAKSGVWAVPAYRMKGLRLDSVEDVGVTARQLEQFLKKA